MSHVVIVASFEMDSGAADRALAMSSASVVGGVTGAVAAAGAGAAGFDSAGGAG